MKRIVVFASGRGSNAAALIDACRSGEINGEIIALVADNPQAGALQMAAEKAIDSGVFEPRSFQTKAAFEEAIVAYLDALRPDLICLAGYMRLIGPTFLQAYEGRIMNIHPSLLPSFPGLHAQEQAWNAGVKVSGCTVHFVDAGMDTGPIIAQTAVSLTDCHDAEETAAKILTVEHPTYIAAVAAFCRDELKLENRRVISTIGRKSE